MVRVGVIGAGPSGMSVLRAFKSAMEKGGPGTDNFPEVVCFEKQEDWGGIWNYTWRTGTDEYGEPVHGSMYRYLFSNGPKECLEFADYTFEEHFGKAIPSYPPREVLNDYIRGRAAKSAAREWCRFRTPVRRVSYDEKTEKFTITVHDLKANKQYSEEFDYVINCSGHFSTPNVPAFPGIERFNGRVMHSHDFRDALEFKGKDILIIGRSYSAEDIGSQCWKYGAKSITVSYRSEPIGFKWPENWSEHPLLQKVEGNTCTFKDGTQKDVDAIILCTGYLHYYPYLPNELRIVDDNRMWVPGLYKGVVWEKNKKFMYIGAQDQFYTFNMFDAQAWFARDVILGRVALPDDATRGADNARWEEREGKLVTAEDSIYFQGDYVQELIDLTDYPSFNVKGVSDTFVEWEHHKEAGIMTYRDRSYKSLMTGTMSPAHHTPWVQAMDDSMKCYLGAKL